MSPDTPKSFGQRAGHAFRRLLVTLLVLALGFVVCVLLARDNARSYSLKLEGGKLIVQKGRMLPWGSAPYRPTDTALAEAYAPIDLGSSTPAAVETDRFDDRDDLDRALFRILETAARPKLLSEDTRVVSEGMGLLRRMDRLQGASEEQKRTLHALQLEVAYDQARIRFEEARRAVSEGLVQLRIAADSPTRRARAAHAMLIKVEPAASALEDVLRQVVVTLAETPPAAGAPPAAPPAPGPAPGADAGER
ncbi:MAG TPA: IF-2 protein [Myxococcaceae bacterium]|nr:IF-2 protein [Myxococcaceae bacterium]